LVNELEKELQIEETTSKKRSKKADSLHKVKGKEVNQARCITAQRIRPVARWRLMYDLVTGRAERYSKRFDFFFHPQMQERNALFFMVSRIFFLKKTPTSNLESEF
jgi:hypothetical protein